MSLSFLASQRRLRACVPLFLGLVALALGAPAAEPATRPFDLPAGHAEAVLKQFSQQAGLQLVFDSRIVADIRLAALRGNFAPLEAAERLLSGTPLRLRSDERSGIVSVERRPAARDHDDGKPRPAAAPPLPAGNASIPMRQNNPIALFLTSLLALSTGPDSAVAQTKPAAKAVPADPADPSAKVVELSPFVVSAGEDTGYRATSTLAGTRIKTDLRDVGAAISVITEQFLRDTGAKNTEDLLIYTTSSEVGGLSGNFSGLPNTGPLRDAVLILRPNNNTRVRGLSAADNTRDFFLSDIPWDSYIVGRVDLQRGPNAILYGLGRPGGIINASLNTAGYKNSSSVETRLGSFGSARGTLDLNRVLLKDELALRFDALHDRTYYRQDPAYNRDRRVFGALRYDPKFLNKRSAHTTLRVNYEHGKIDANRPRMLPPFDRVTPWFETGTTTVNGRTFNHPNKGTYDLLYAFNYFPSVPGSGAGLVTSPNYVPAITTIVSGNVAYFGDQNSSQQSGNFYVPTTTRNSQFGRGPTGAIDRNILGLPNTGGGLLVTGSAPTDIAAIRMGVPFANDFKSRSITDTSFYDYHNKLIDGPTKSEGRAFEAVNAVLSQTFFKNRAGIEAAWDRQRYQDAQFAVFDSVGGITVDVNNQRPDNTPNPNVGRPMIFGRSNYSGSLSTQSKRESSRLTGFAELRATDWLGHSRLARFLGRHVLTGLASRDQYSREVQTWARYAVNSGSEALLENAFDPYRELLVISYLGPDLRNRSSTSGLNLSNLTAAVNPNAPSIVTFDSRWKQPTDPAASGYVNPGAVWVNPFNNQTSTQSENPANYAGWRTVPISVLDAKDDRRLLTNAARKSRDKFRSQVFVWQGFFWDGTLVPTFGYRKDTAKAYAVSAPMTPAGYVNQEPAAYSLPGIPLSTVSGATKSYSVVMHTPRFLRAKLPAGLNLSLFVNRSQNFEPAASRVDILAKPLPPPTGKTKDYGIVISALDNRLTLKINKYESRAENASYGLFNPRFIGQIETIAWVGAKRFEAGLTGDPQYAGPDYNYGSNIDGVFTQTPEDRALQQQHVKAVLDNFAPEIWDAWNLSPTDRRWQTDARQPFSAGFSGDQPLGMTATSDSVSRGYEFELHARPVESWDIAFNASRTEASLTNIAGNMRAWIEARNEVWNGLAGEMRNGTGYSTGKIKDSWNSNFYNSYALRRLLEGSNSSELRRWRYNLVTSYRFTGGKLRGAKFGGAYRWEDKVSIGYPSIKVDVKGAQLDSYDIARPFWGPTATSIDLWVGYERKLAQKFTWRGQLNVQNVFGKNELIPINAQPDGSAAAFRIKQGPTWSLTNSFAF